MCDTEGGEMYQEGILFITLFLLTSLNTQHILVKELIQASKHDIGCNHCKWMLTGRGRKNVQFLF